MFNPLVTVMIPTYNQEKYIAKSIRSVLEQSYSNIEIIVSDDSSNDLTEQIIAEQFSSDVYYIHNKKAHGRVGNYHFILYTLAHGEWVINLDGDDYFYDKTFIEKAMMLVHKHKELVLIFGKQIVYKEALKKEYRYTNKYLKQGVLDGDNLFLNTVFKNIEIPHVASLYKREEALAVGFYEFDILSSDRMSLLKLILNHKVAFLDTFVGVWNHHASNISQNSTFEDFISNLTMFDELYLYALRKSRSSRINLWLWKWVATYKSVYAHFIKYHSIDEKRAFLKKLFVFKLELFFLFLFDFRIYTHLLKRKRDAIQ